MDTKQSLTQKIMDIASYITGFADGEGCFSVSFNYRKKLNTGIEVRPSFSVSQKRFSLGSLKLVQNYFDCGGIRYSSRDGTYKYEVRSLKDLSEKIIPHFKKYPLQTTKSEDFKKFTQICKMMRSSLHLNTEKLKEIIELAYQMNQSGKRRYAKKDLIKNLKVS